MLFRSVIESHAAGTKAGANAVVARASYPFTIISNNGIVPDPTTNLTCLHSTGYFQRTCEGSVAHRLLNSARLVN